MWKSQSVALAMTVLLTSVLPAASDDIVVPEVVAEIPRSAPVQSGVDNQGSVERIEKQRTLPAIVATLQQARADQRAAGVQRVKNVSDSARAAHRGHAELQQSLAVQGSGVHFGQQMAAADLASAATQSFGAVSVADAKVAEIAAEKRGEALVETVNAVKEVKLEEMRQGGAFLSTMLGNPAGAMRAVAGGDGAGGGKAKPKAPRAPTSRVSVVAPVPTVSSSAKDPSIGACLATSVGGASAGLVGGGPKGAALGGINAALASEDCRGIAGNAAKKVERLFDERFGPLGKPTRENWLKTGLPIVPPSIPPGT